MSSNCTTKCHTNNTSSNNPIISFPSGTRLIPDNRTHVPNSTIEIKNEIEVKITQPLIVEIDDTLYDIYLENTNHNSNIVAGGINNDFSFTVSSGTKYFILDMAIDPVGLIHVLEVDNKFRHENGTICKLKKDTVIKQHNTDIKFKLVDDTNCRLL